MGDATPRSRKEFLGLPGLKDDISNDERLCCKVLLGFSIALNLSYGCQKIYRQSFMSIDFKSSHYSKEYDFICSVFYIRYAVSYQDLEEIMFERGVQPPLPLPELKWLT